MNPILNFDGVIGDIAIKNNVLKHQQREDLYFSLAVFEAAHQQGIDILNGRNPNDMIKDYNTADAMGRIAEQHGVSKQNILALVETYRKGAQPQHGPFIMKAAEAMGFVNSQQKSCLMAAQSGMNINRSIDELKQKSSTITLNEALNEKNKKPKFPNEPEYLHAAQSAERMTNILVAAVNENTELRKDKDIQRALTSAELLAGQSFKRGHEDAKNITGMEDAAQAMKWAREGQRKEVNVLSKVSATSTLVEKLEKGVEKAAAKSPNHKDAMLAAMKEEKQTIKNLKVFGSLVSPKPFFGRVELQEVIGQHTANAVNGGRGGHGGRGA